MRTLVIVFTAAVLTGCRREAPAEAASTAEAPAVPVQIIQVSEQEMPLTVPVTGTLVSLSRVDVKAETTGRVIRFQKEEGDMVRAGEPVVWVDSENSRLAVKQAESAVLVSEAGLERAKVLESHSAAELERARNLLASGGITDKDLKAAQVAEQDAHAQVALAAAQLEQARASLEVVRKRMADAVVKAPVSGEIQRKYLNAGAYVEPPTAVFSVVDNSRLELESSIPSSEIGSIRAGQRAAFTVNSYPGVTFEGRVIDVGPALDTESRAVKARIQASGRGKLKAGMFAEGEIITGIQSRAVVVPLSAVCRDDRAGKEAFVYVVKNGKASRRAVRTGREIDSSVQILNGLAGGDAIVAEPGIDVGEGVAIQARR
jgi:RND family efflux transporter MFP subunit